MALQIVKAFLPKVDIDRLDEIAMARGPQGGSSRSSIIREAVLLYLARDSQDARARVVALGISSKTALRDALGDGP